MINLLTNSGVRVGQLVRAIVIGLQRERLSPVKGQHFGERCCMVLRKYLTITATNEYCILNIRLDNHNQLKGKEQKNVEEVAYLIPSSAAECHFKEMG